MANNLKSTVTGALTRPQKNAIADYLRILRDHLNKSVKDADLEGSITFQRSPLYIDYSSDAIKKEVRVSIVFKEGTDPTKRKEIESAKKSIRPRALANKFNAWFSEDLKKSFSSRVKHLDNEEALWDIVKDEMFKSKDGKSLLYKTVPSGRWKKLKGKKPPDIKKGTTKIYVVNDINKSLLIYYSTGADDQKDSFNTTILKNIRKKAYSRTQNVNDKEKIDAGLYWDWIQSIHLGHTFGLKASQLGQIFKYPKDSSLSKGIAENTLRLKGVESIPHKLVRAGLTRTLITILDIDINVNVEKNFNPRSDGFIQGLTLEFGPDNSESGREIKSRLNYFLNTQIVKAIDLLEQDDKLTAGQLIGLISSKNSEELILDSIIDTFIGKKAKPYRSKNKKRTKVTNRINNKASTQKMSLGAKIIAELGFDGLDLNSKIPYLNTRLHDKIQQNMGKGRSKQILNYRTGRFAKSAEIQAFAPSREKGAVIAQVKYMKDPYQVFEPGMSRLALPGRDPHRIFGRSIRQLLQEEKIANLRRVKVELRG